LWAFDTRTKLSVEVDTRTNLNSTHHHPLASTPDLGAIVAAEREQKLDAVRARFGLEADAAAALVRKASSFFTSKLKLEEVGSVQPLQQQPQQHEEEATLDYPARARIKGIAGVELPRFPAHVQAEIDLGSAQLSPLKSKSRSGSPELLGAAAGGKQSAMSAAKRRSLFVQVPLDKRVSCALRSPMAGGLPTADRYGGSGSCAPTPGAADAAAAANTPQQPPSKAEQLEAARHERAAKWAALEAAKPDARALAPEDAAALTQAIASIGELPLRGAPGFVPPEEQRATPDKKRIEMARLAHDMALACDAFDGRVAALAAVRAGVQARLDAIAARLAVLCDGGDGGRGGGSSSSSSSKAERQNLLREARDTAAAFDAELAQLAADRCAVEADLAGAAGCMLTRYEELAKLKEFEEREGALQSCRAVQEAECNALASQLTDLDAKVAVAAADAERFAAAHAASEQAFQAWVAESAAPFSAALSRLFYSRRVGKRASRWSRGGGGQDGSASNDGGNSGSSSGSDEDGLSNNDGDDASFELGNSDGDDGGGDGAAVQGREASCPPGCPQAVHDRMLELRDARLEHSDALAGVARDIEALRKERDAVVRKARAAEQLLAKAETVRFYFGWCVFVCCVFCAFAFLLSYQRGFAIFHMMQPPSTQTKNTHRSSWSFSASSRRR
jgi:hypothetical protein